MSRISGTSMNMRMTSSIGRRGSTILRSSFSNRPCKRAFPMHNVKQFLTLLAVGLMPLNSSAADAPDRPLHVLYLGPVDVGRGGRGGFGGRTNYVYLPGQTL